LGGQACQTACPAGEAGAGWAQRCDAGASAADLHRRVFALDVLACPDCGGRLRLLATIDDRAVVEKILTHLGLSVALPQPAAARTPE